MGGRQGGGRVVVRGPQHSSLGQDGITYQGELAWLLDAGWEVDSCSGQLPPSPPPSPPAERHTQLTSKPYWSASGRMPTAEVTE